MSFSYTNARLVGFAAGQVDFQVTNNLPCRTRRFGEKL